MFLSESLKRSQRYNFIFNYTSLRSLDFAVSKLFAKLFRTSDISVVNERPKLLIFNYLVRCRKNVEEK